MKKSFFGRQGKSEFQERKKNKWNERKGRTKRRKEWNKVDVIDPFLGVLKTKLLG